MGRENNITRARFLPSEVGAAADDGGPKLISIIGCGAPIWARPQRAGAAEIGPLEAICRRSARASKCRAR